MASNCVIFSTWWIHDISEIFRSINLRSMIYPVCFTHTTMTSYHRHHCKFLVLLFSLFPPRGLSGVL